MTNNSYVLAHGKSGMDRLNLIDKLYSDNSMQFLKKAGMMKCKAIADIGCGVGNVTCRIAEEIGNTNVKIIGIDNSEEQLIIAREKAQSKGLTHIEFHKVDIYECKKYTDYFDLVYCRSLLIHLKDPLAALHIMVNMLHAGGILACEEYNLSSCFSYPSSDAIKTTLQLFAALATKYALDPEIGIKLYSIFKKMNLHSISISFSQPVPIDSEDRFLISMGLQERTKKLLEEKIIDQGELDKLFLDLQQVEKNKNFSLAYWRFCQISGIKN